MASLPAPTFCAVRLFVLPLHGIPAQLSGNFLFKCFFMDCLWSPEVQFSTQIDESVETFEFPIEKIAVLSYD